MASFKGIFIFFKNLLKRDIKYASTAPTRALLFMTYRCTSQCKMCTIWRRGREVEVKKELSLDEWKKVIDDLNQMNIDSVELFGGDSLIRKDVTIPLIKYIKKINSKIAIDLPTNCNLVDKETAENLIKAGLTRIYVSLDGPADIHDKVRGVNGTYSRVTTALKNFVQAKKEMGKKMPFIIVNCTVTSSNINYFEKIIPELEKIGVDAVDFEYVGEFKNSNIKNSFVDGINPTPFYVNSGKSNLLNRKQAVLLKKKMKDIKKLASKLNIVISTRHMDSLTIDNIVNGTIPNKKCYMSRYLVTIDPFGNVMGCFHYNNYIMGNVKNESIFSIWNNKKHQKFLKAIKNGDIKICENCISGVNRNPTSFQLIHRTLYFAIKRKGFDSP